jgi:hypothetical protein
MSMLTFDTHDASVNTKASKCATPIVGESALLNWRRTSP